MTERQHTHAAAHVEPASADPEISPGRSRSSNLVAPTHPIVSGLIRRKARDANGVAADADVAIASASGGTGAPLPSTLQRKFEASLGADLSGVRVHTDASSASAADSVGARAYTIGRDIHFGAGQYDPSSVAGEHLLAHEVAHTVQQASGTPARQNKLEVSAPGDALEIEADRAADAMLTGQSFAMSSAPAGVFRKPDDPEEVAKAEAEKALIAWERQGGASIDSVQQWLLGNWIDYLGATSGNPRLGWADGTVASIANNAAGNLLTTLGEGMIRKGSAAIAGGLVGSVAGPVGSVVGFAIGTLVEAVAGMIFDSIMGKTDADKAAADASARAAALINSKRGEIAGKTSAVKSDLHAGIDAARTRLTSAASNEEVMRIRDHACREVAQLPAGNAADRSLSNKMIADWTREHAADPRGANGDTSDAQWQAAAQRAFGKDNLYGHLETFAYQCRGAWAQAGFVDPHSDAMIKDAEAAKPPEDALVRRWAGKSFVFTSARDPNAVVAFLAKNGVTLNDGNKKDIASNQFTITCLLRLATENPSRKGYNFSICVNEWVYWVKMFERTGVDAGTAEWTRDFTCSP